ncbi:MAG: bacterial Ig-like domain-containing protein [Clostridia bacterium]|nr:bacterial Ig-like domain-containing protein [Clostridia bacterium]
MKKTAKFLSLVLALIIAMSAFSISGFAVATPLEAGDSMETAVEIPEFGVQYVGSLSSTSEADWYRFTTDSNDAYYNIVLVNYSLPEGLHYFQNPYLQLLDINEKEIDAFHGSYGDGNLSVKLENETTYYIKVTHEQVSEKGNYEITVSVDYDAVPNEMENAATVEYDALIPSELDGYGDVDWFKFVAPILGSYEIVFDDCELKSDSSGPTWCAHICLYDPFSQTLDSGFASFGNDVYLNADLEEGVTYYIQINMGGSSAAKTGKYTFIINTPLKNLVTLTSISLASAPEKTEYLVGDMIDVNGLSVEAAYSDGTNKTVEGYSITGFDSSTAGTKTVTITYTENGVTCTCTFDVTVSEPAPAVELLGIAYVTLPDKTSYKVGESFNKSGLVVSAQYSDGSSKVVTDYTISGFDSSTAGTKTVTVSYTEDGITKTSKFNVNVVAEKKLIAISVASMPTKTVYQVGEDFDASGLIVNTFHDDGTSAFVTDYTVSGFDSETAGTKTVVVTYTDKDITKSCTFEVTVEEPEDSGNFFTDLINWLMNFFMSIIEFFTALLGG